MTKSVLDLGNAILKALKKHYPDQIEYAQPEVPMKDLGLRVYLVGWNDALKMNASLDMQQAIVYSGSSIEEESLLSEQLTHWTSSHPLILPVLDAKGLEFDDGTIL
jgi:hypothetical protein